MALTGTVDNRTDVVYIRTNTIQEVRCPEQDCHRQWFRIIGENLEIKCPKCNSIHVIPLATIR